MIEDMSINYFLEDDRFFPNEHEKKDTETLVKVFIQVFNALKREVFENGQAGMRYQLNNSIFISLPNWLKTQIVFCIDSTMFVYVPLFQIL